jgi:hypothetical protein
MVEAGVEPAAYGVSRRCSSTELHDQFPCSLYPRDAAKQGMVRVGIEPTTARLSDEPEQPATSAPKGDRAELNRRLLGHNQAL